MMNRKIIDNLTADLSDRYKLYLETLMVDLWTEAEMVEFRCGFTLRSDHALRSVVFKASVTRSTPEDEREAITIAVFEELEQQIDEIIASAGQKSN